MDLSLILLSTSCEIYSIPKEARHIAIFLSINHETQRVSLLFLSSRIITYTTSSILGILSLEKKNIKCRLVIEILSNLDTG